MTEFEWDKSKIKFLKTYYPVNSNAKVAEFLKCTIYDVQKKATELNLEKIVRARWTADQDEYLRKHYATADWDEMIETLVRNKNSISARARALGLKRTAVEIDEDYILKHYNGYNLHQLAEEIGCSISAINEVINKNKVHQTKIPITNDLKAKRREVVKAMNQGRTKICVNCGMESNNPIKDFNVDYQKAEGLRLACKTCIAERERKNNALRSLNEQVRKENRWRKEIEKQTFQCKGCGGTFKGGDMSIIVSQLYVTPWCKSCQNKRQKEYRIDRMLKKARGEV